MMGGWKASRWCQVVEIMQKTKSTHGLLVRYSTMTGSRTCSANGHFARSEGGCVYSCWIIHFYTPGTDRQHYVITKSSPHKAGCGNSATWCASRWTTKNENGPKSLHFPSQNSTILNMKQCSRWDFLKGVCSTKFILYFCTKHLIQQRIDYIKTDQIGTESKQKCIFKIV